MIPLPPIPTGNRRSRGGLTARLESHWQEKLQAMFTHAPVVAATAEASSLHRMRLASRRLRVGLRYFESLFPPGEYKQVQRQLKRLTRALGEIRTFDRNFQLLRSAAKKLPASTAAAQRHSAAAIQKLCASAVISLRELLGALRTGHFEPRIQALIVKHQPRDDKRLLGEAKDHVSDLRRRLRRRFEKTRGDHDTGPDFHKFRLAAKRYRYALETSREIFDVNASSRLRALEDLQDHLGACHDLEVLLDFLHDTLRTARKSDKTLAAALDTMIAFFTAAHERAFERYQKFLKEDRIWLKKVKLSLPRG